MGRFERYLSLWVALGIAAGPHRASLAGGLVAYREHEIQMRRIGPRKLVPVLAAQPIRADPVASQQLQRDWIDLACRLAPRAEATKAALPNFVEDGFSQDAAG